MTKYFLQKIIILMCVLFVAQKTAIAQYSQLGPKVVATYFTEPGQANQGYSVAVSADGNTAVVGGPADNDQVGAFWIYIRSDAGEWTQQGEKLVGTGAVGTSTQGTSVGISADGNTVIVGGGFDDGEIGACWIFTRSPEGKWSQQGNKLVGTNATFSIQGISVSISADGNTAIVGGWGDNDETGAAWIFTRSVEGEWTQQGDKIVSDNTDHSDFGNSVSISADGNTAVIGAAKEDDNIGAVRVFIRTGVTWTQQGAKLVGTNGVGDSFQGAVSISADGNTILVGGQGDNNNTGAAWIFTRSELGIWTQQGDKLVGTGAVGESTQGDYVAISADGKTAVVGGRFDNNYLGAAWVFTSSDDGEWIQQGGKLVGSNAVGTNAQGTVSISGDGNTILLGGVFDNNGLGAVWFFDRTADKWKQNGEKLVGSGVTFSRAIFNFGQSIAISRNGTTAVVGENVGYNVSDGAARVFILSEEDGWVQQGDKLKGTGATGVSHQGESVAISADGNTVVVGGNEDDNNTGAVWVFSRVGNMWTQQGNKLLGSDAIGQAEQGTSVAVSGDGNTLVLGGPFDDFGMGAIWIFTRSGNVWTQQGEKLVASDGVGSIDFGNPNFGNSVSISADGNTVIVGGEGDNSRQGAAWIFSRSGNLWAQQGSKIVPGSDVSEYAEIGSSVSISADGNTVIIGGAGDNGNIGAAWIYSRSGSVWNQEAKLSAADPEEINAQQGYSVGISADGTKAVVGEYSYNSNVGATWAYFKRDGVWAQEGAKLVGLGATNGANQGRAVAISGNGKTILSGGPRDDDEKGAFWVFAYSNPLAVSFININANAEKDHVLINWKVAQEIQVDNYVVERSSDGFRFVKIGTVVANGSSSYKFIDESPLNGDAYYRVKSNDFSGAVKYSDIVKLVAAIKPASITISPNPVIGRTLNVQFNNLQKGAYQMQLTDVGGRRLLNSSVEFQGGTGLQKVTLPSVISNGLYQLQITRAGKVISVQKVLIDNRK